MIVLESFCMCTHFISYLLAVLFIHSQDFQCWSIQISITNYIVPVWIYSCDKFWYFVNLKININVQIQNCPIPKENSYYIMAVLFSPTWYLTTAEIVALKTISLTPTWYLYENRVAILPFQLNIRSVRTYWTATHPWKWF